MQNKALLILNYISNGIRAGTYEVKDANLIRDLKIYWKQEVIWVPIGDQGSELYPCVAIIISAVCT